MKKRQNKKEKLIRCSRASVSVMLSLLVLPVYAFAGTIADCSRLSAARLKAAGAGETAMNSALASYDDTEVSVRAFCSFGRPP